MEVSLLELPCVLARYVHVHNFCGNMHKSKKTDTDENLAQSVWLPDLANVHVQLVAHEQSVTSTKGLNIYFTFAP